MSPAPRAINKAKPLSSDDPPRPIFCYGTLMSPQIYCRVTGRQSRPPSRPASLHGYRRHGVVNATYPAIVPWYRNNKSIFDLSRKFTIDEDIPSFIFHCISVDCKVDGLLVYPETHEEVRHLDAFESDDYARETLTIMSEAPVEADVYVWVAPHSLLESNDWSFSDFLQRRLRSRLRPPGYLADDEDDDELDRELFGGSVEDTQGGHPHSESFAAARELDGN